MLSRLLMITGLGFAMQGCALTDSTLDIGVDAAAVSMGPISETESKVFVVNQLEDAREDQLRIGYKKNSFGQNLGDVTTAVAVPVIIADAISAAAVANGHTIGENGIAVDGVINKFWVESDINFSNIEIVCSIVADLKFTDTKTDSLIYSANYSASYGDKKQMATEKNRLEVIDGAIQAFIDEIVFDEELAGALQGYGIP